MPKLMEKEDWIQTVAKVSAAERVWCENVTAREGTLPLSVPESSAYQVIMVKIGESPKAAAPRRKSARDFIGHCRKFNPEYRSTTEIMRELREGECSGCQMWKRATDCSHLFCGAGPGFQR